MVVKKRCLLWDWTNTKNCPDAIEKLNFHGPISALSNWNTWTPPELKGRLPFRPMVRQEPQLTGQDWANIENSDQPIIHYFNEPERGSITAKHAAEKWFQQMVPLRKNKGKKLVSPSCANDVKGQAWLAEFMKLVVAGPPDFLGLHYYGTNSRDAIGFIESMHGKYPNQPIIVSEIASISRDYGAVLEFTTQLCNWMDEQSYIFEYAFFGCMATLADDFVSPAAQLMDKDGGFKDLMRKLMAEQPMKG